MKFVSNERQIPCRAIVAVYFEYLIHGPHLLLEIAGSDTLFLLSTPHDSFLPPFSYNTQSTPILIILISINH